MAQIDMLIEKMQQHDMRRMVLVSDQPIELYSSKGRTSGATLTEAQIQGLLQEATPSHLKQQVAMKENVDFLYTPLSGSPVTVTVFDDRGVLRVIVATTAKKSAKQIAASFQLSVADGYVSPQALTESTDKLTVDQEEEPDGKAVPQSRPARIQQVTANDFIKEVWDSPKPVAVIFYDVGVPQPNWEIFNRMADYFAGGLKFVRCPFDTGDDRYYRYVNVGGGKYASLALVIFQGEQVIYKPALGSVDALDWMMEIENVLVSMGVEFAKYSGDRHKPAQAPANTKSASVAPRTVAQPAPSFVQPKPQTRPASPAVPSQPRSPTSVASSPAPKPQQPKLQSEGWYYATEENGLALLLTTRSSDLSRLVLSRAKVWFGAKECTIGLRLISPNLNPCSPGKAVRLRCRQR